MSPHFSAAELACRCGCGFLPPADFVRKLETLRELYGQPMRVTSAARCPAHNAVVSTTGATGPHTTGRAIDIAVTGADAHRLLVKAIVSGMFTGIGIAQKGGRRFIHLDDLPNTTTSPRPRVWSY